MKMSRELREGFMQIAFAVAKLSDCTRSKVGAVAVDPTGRMLFPACNMIEWGFSDKTCATDCPRGQHSYEELPSGAPFEGDGRCIANHAEMRALSFYFRHPDGIPKGVVIFITHKPCEGCAAFMRMNGVTWYAHEEFPLDAIPVDTP